MSRRLLLAFALVVSVSCTSPVGNGDHGELLIMPVGGRLHVGCRNDLRIARVEQDDAPTSCRKPSHGCSGNPSGKLSGVLALGGGGLMGCTRLTATTPVTVKSVTCNDSPCQGWKASSVGPGISFEPTSSGPLRIHVVADVDGSEVEDTTTLQVEPGPCIAAVDAGRPPVRDAAGANGSCRLDSAFAPPVPLAGLDGFPAAHPSLAAIDNGGSETALLFDTPADGGGTRVLRAQRSMRSSPFGEPVPVPGLDGPTTDYEARFVASIAFPFVFASDRSDAGAALFVSLEDGGATPIAGAGSNGEEGQPFVLGDALWFASSRDGDWEIYESRRDGDAVSSVTHVFELGSTWFDGYPVVSEDGLTIFFASNRPSPRGRGVKIWTASRSNDSLPFSAPALLAELATYADELPGSLSPDGCRLYFTRRDGAVSHLYVAERLP